MEDKLKLPLALVVVLVTQTFGAAWFISNMDHRISNLETDIADLESTIEELEEEVENNRESVLDLYYWMEE